MNFILRSDSYKYSHWLQYPPNTTAMSSYFESRGGRFSHTLFFGLQYYLKEYLTRRITKDEVDEAATFMALHGEPFNYDGWAYIARDLGGKLPVRIRAVAEGSVIPAHNALFTIESTDPKVFWIVSWLETMLVQVWYPTIAATQSYFIKQNIRQYLSDTADDPDAEIPFKLHDFGYRGVSSQESAAIGGAAHLVNFMGSDTVAGIFAAQRYYGCKSGMPAFSIPASEHSTMTMWGKERESDAYLNMLNVYRDSPIFACVSDSYNIYNAAGNIWGGNLKASVEVYNGTLVIRPDSGDPKAVVGSLLLLLEQKFGSTVNAKGYKVLNKVRIIQGDGVNDESINDILSLTKESGFSASNISFGMGGALLQKLDRDTNKFAFKCSWAMVDGKEVDVFKDPVTDLVKKSKRGRLDLNHCHEGGVQTVRFPAENSLLDVVYENGEIVKEYSFDEVRENARQPMLQQYNGWVDKPVD